MPTPKRRLSPTVVELEGEFDHRMLHTRGVRLHAVTAGNPADPLILLLHGTFGGWFDFSDVIAPLARRGFYVAALDMRGYGMSDKPRQRPGNETLVAVGDVKGAIAALGHASAVLAGADTGGAIAWVTAATHPEVVSGLVSISAAHPADLRLTMAARPWNFLPVLGRVGVTRLPARLLGPFERARIRAIRDNLAQNTTSQFQRSRKFADVVDLRRTAAAIDNAFVHSVHNSRLLTGGTGGRQHVSVPTLLMHPRHNPWDRLAQRQRRRLHGPVEEIAVQAAKNLPHIENPAGFTAAVAAFAGRC